MTKMASEKKTILAPDTRVALRNQVIKVALQAFMKDGIKSITMDEIASDVGISKRTLYEIFKDKESLMQSCILWNRAQSKRYLTEVTEKSQNVIEIIWICFLHHVEQIRKINKAFFEDLKKYPALLKLLNDTQEEDASSSLRFFRMGIEQKLFREDVCYEILNKMLNVNLSVLLDSEILGRFSLANVYATVMFTFIRGIATPKGVEELDKFINNQYIENVVQK